MRLALPSVFSLCAYMQVTRNTVFQSSVTFSYYLLVAGRATEHDKQRKEKGLCHAPRNSLTNEARTGVCFMRTRIF